MAVNFAAQIVLVDPKPLLQRLAERILQKTPVPPDSEGNYRGFPLFLVALDQPGISTSLHMCKAA